MQRDVRSTEILDAIPLPHDEPCGYLTIIQVEYTEGDTETYSLPLTFATDAEATELWKNLPRIIAARLYIERSGQRGVLYDALWSPEFARMLLESTGQHRTFRGTAGEVLAYPVRAFPPTSADPVELTPTTRPEQSNTTVIYGEQLALKLFRRLESGPNPELEIGRFLSERVTMARAPRLSGALEYYQKNSEPITLAVLQDYVPNQGSIWQETQDELRRYFERVLSSTTLQHVLPVPAAHLLDLADQPVSALARELVDAYLDTAHLLGQRTAELHVALAQETDDPGFAPEPFSDFYQRPFFHGMVGLMERCFRLLRQRTGQLPETIRADVWRVLEREDEIRSYFVPFRDRRITAMRIRCHGNYHLGQVLRSGDDVVITDFEGESTRAIEERRNKGSPLRDVASMLRSFHRAVYAGLDALDEIDTRRPALRGIHNQQERLSWTGFWYNWVSAVFLHAYLDTVSQSPLLLQTREEFQMLLDAYLLEYMLHEINNTLHTEPEQVQVALRGMLHILSSQRE
jgi:maltose alpha-D-glucosyltransferase/alpha-amylase